MGISKAQSAQAKAQRKLNAANQAVNDARALDAAIGRRLAEARKKLEAIQAELKGGKSFEDLARQHSTSPSKATGGDLGWMNKGFLRASIEEAAGKLKPEQVSAPIETDKDLYLIQLIALEDAPVKAFAEVKAKILEKLQEPKAQNAIEQYLSNLRMRANIRFLVPKEQILKG